MKYPDAMYIVESNLLNAIDDLMHRLYSERKMDANEMRDWANKLYACTTGSFEPEIYKP